MVRPMRKTRAPTQSQRAIGHIAALQSIATMFVMHAMVGRSTLQFKMPRLDAYSESSQSATELSIQLLDDVGDGFHHLAWWRFRVNKLLDHGNNPLTTPVVLV